MRPSPLAAASTLFLFSCFLQISAQQQRRVEWVQARNGTVPPGAVIAGREGDGPFLYAGRYFLQGHLLPMKINPSKQMGYVGLDGREYYINNDYWVLVNEKVGWVDYKGGKVPKTALVGGYTADNEPLYFGRAPHLNSIQPGKVQRSKGCLLLAFAGGEICKTSYEIMVLLDQNK